MMEIYDKSNRKMQEDIKILFWEEKKKLEANAGTAGGTKKSKASNRDFDK